MRIVRCEAPAVYGWGFVHFDRVKNEIFVFISGTGCFDVLLIMQSPTLPKIMA